MQQTRSTEGQPKHSIFPSMSGRTWMVIVPTSFTPSSVALWKADSSNSSSCASIAIWKFLPRKSHTQLLVIALHRFYGEEQYKQRNLANICPLLLSCSVGNAYLRIWFRRVLRKKYAPETTLFPCRCTCNSGFQIRTIFLRTPTISPDSEFHCPYVKLSFLYIWKRYWC